MSILSIVSRFEYFQRFSRAFWDMSAPRSLPELILKKDNLPWFVQQSPVAIHCLDLLGQLSWDQFPERNLYRNWGKQTIPYASFAGACLIKLDRGLICMSQLHRYLRDHPALIWVLGFPLVKSSQYPWGFDVAASLPTHRHFTRMLRTMPNRILQFLLDDTVQALKYELADVADDFGQTISLDTKHILAWVKENNPKAYIKASRFDKEAQPRGDPDCRLGCKRRHNQRASSKEPPPTPDAYAVPADTISVGEFYWGYGSGVVATKVPDWGEFVLAEFTQPFDKSDVSYFFPLMADVERRLGFRPRFGAFDAGFDAHYVYEYFHRNDEDGGFAAIPFSQRGGHKKSFDKNGLPLCEAGLAMPLKYHFTCRTTLVEHERGRYCCPVFYPEPSANECPINHKNYSKGGCRTTMATSIGARLRYQLDRKSEAYKKVYKQRTATERVNAQAKGLGIERPKIRNGQGIANQNTLIYVLINLRALQRIQQRKLHLQS